MMIASVVVVGDTGEEYMIGVDPVTGAVRCSCPSYRYATVKICKHIAFLGTVLGESASK